MEKKVLVTFCSTSGSTQEVAERVADTLRGCGLVVDLIPMRAVGSIGRYSGVVCGSPLYLFHLHKDAQRFLKKHREELSGSLPVAIFAGGPFGEKAAEQMEEVRRSLAVELEKYPWLKPVSVHVIGGKFDPHRLRFPWNLVPAMRNMPASDARDWDAIRDWSSGLAVKLAPEEQSQPEMA